MRSAIHCAMIGETLIHEVGHYFWPRLAPDESTRERRSIDTRARGCRRAWAANARHTTLNSPSRL